MTAWEKLEQAMKEIEAKDREEGARQPLGSQSACALCVKRNECKHHHSNCMNIEFEMVKEPEDTFDTSAVGFIGYR